MAATESGSTGPRYAPEDPTLPKPWRALVDGATGYLYYWNPEMNITQYERPTAARSSPSGHPSTTPKLAPVSLSSTVQSGPGPRTRSSSHHSQHKGGSHSIGLDKNYDDNRGGMTCNERQYSGGNDSMVERQPKLAPIPAARNQQHQGTRSGSGHQQNVPSSHSNGSIRGSSNMHGHGPSSQAFSSNQSQRSSARMHSSLDTGNASSLDAYRREHEISVTGENVPAPFITFDQTGFPTEILREVHSAGFSAPTPIQAQTWPIALQSRDIVAIAKTGSGKTLGYLVPGFIHLKRSQRNSQMGPSVLVLSPTRELATQIQDEARKFGRSSRISCTCLYGGAPKGPQLRELDRGVDIVVATPGRLNDIIEMKRISLRQVSYLVLDEADRMLDMGFEPQIRKIVNEIPPRRQTLMYTATWPKEVRKIAGDLLVNPVQVNIGNMDELAANKSITQYVEVVPPMEKQRRLEQILRSQEPGSKVLIFCSTKRMCDQLARSMSRQFGAAAIHGDKSQGERDWVLNQFRNGKSPILVATDVAARGLDIKDIRVVINYDFPTGVEDYVHRIGRTGRAGATGVSYTFFSEQDRKYATDLVKVLKGANQRVPPEIHDMAIRSAGMHKGRGRWDYGSRHANRETSRANGGRNDGHGRRGGRGPPLSGNLDRGPGAPGGRGGGRTERSPPHDRRGRGHPGGHAVDTNGRHGRGFPGRGRAGDRDRGRSHSRSQSRSYSPTSSPGHRWGFSRSRSRSHSYGKGRSRSRSRSRSPNRFGGGLPVSGRSPLVWGNSSPVKRDSLPLAAGTRSPYRSENAGADLFHSPSPQQQRSPDLSPRRSGRTPVGDLDHSPEQHPWGLMQDMDVMAEQVGSTLPVRQLSPPRYQDDDSGEEGMITPDGDVGSSGMMMQDPEPVD